MKKNKKKVKDQTKKSKKNEMKKIYEDDIIKMKDEFKKTKIENDKELIDKSLKKLIINQLTINFNIINSDFMGYNLNIYNDYSYHHIIKKEYGGLTTYSNGAILNRNLSHNYLHIIENRDLDMYIKLNKIIKIINEQRYLPTDKQLLQMYECLEEFERRYCNTLNKRHELLIKEDYIKCRKVLKKSFIVSNKE